MSNIIANFLIMVYATALITESITVGPMPNRPGCRSNKIAPQNRRLGRYIHDNQGQGKEARTLGYFYDLLVDRNDFVRPQADTSDDCDDDDTATGAGNTDSSRFLFNWFGNNKKPVRPGQGVSFPGQGGNRPDQDINYPGQVTNYPSQGNQPIYLGSNGPVRPTRPQNPSYPPTRPPYHSGGMFAQANRPQIPQRPDYPSNSVKPVYEDQSGDRPNAHWRPGSVVAGPSGHLVGATSALHRPPQQQSAREFAGPRVGILGSFVDLFLK